MRLSASITLYGGGPGSGNFNRPKRDPTAIIMNNRMKRARIFAKHLIHFRFGSSMVRRMKKDHWAAVAKTLQIEPPSDETRKMIIGLLDKRWKVKAK